MAIINSEYIENNVDIIVDFIENYPHPRNSHMLYNIGTQTNNPVVLEALKKKGITQEVLNRKQ